MLMVRKNARLGWRLRLQLPNMSWLGALALSSTILSAGCGTVSTHRITPRPAREPAPLIAQSDMGGMGWVLVAALGTLAVMALVIATQDDGAE